MQRERVVSAMAGDRDAFSLLATAASTSLHRTAQRILRDEHAADDAVQDALIAAWLGLGGLRDPDRFEAWLHRLIVRSSRRLGRAERHRALRMAALTQRLPPPVTDDRQDVVAVRDQLDRAFDRLTRTQRSILILRYHLDLPLSMAARVMGVPLGTAKSRLNHAQRALRAAVDADERIAHR